ncbi:dihydroorotate dehydrogenase electron transfer subunit [Chloroflexota bacterium]
MKQIKARIISNSEVMPDTRLIWLECPPIAGTARPGQFVMVRCGEDTLLRRPLSVHQIDESKTRLSLLFAVVGLGTAWLAERRAGDTADIFGPLGNGFTIAPTAKKLLLVAGGIGIAPLAFLADEAKKQGGEVFLFIGARNSAYLLPDELLPTGINTIHSTEDGSAGFQGIVTAAWANMHLQYQQYQDIQDVFSCGPLPMYKAMAEMPELKGKNVQVSLEIMMGCGAGICYGCTIKTKQGLRQVCKDGPVFELKDIIWEGV